MMEHFTSPVILGFDQVSARVADLLRDESNLAGSAVDRVYLPENTRQVADAVRQADLESAPLTVGGARTGITGGAVPTAGDWVLSLSRMTRILASGVDPASGQGWIRVEAGLSLADLDRLLAESPPETLPPPAAGGGTGWAYPVDPTEWSASVGGTVATNASGARSFRFGPTGSWVRALTVVLPDGRIRDVRRGQVRARDGLLDWPEGVGRLRIPSLRRPRSKSVAGYDVRPDVDLVDLLVGSEGTLAVITEVELALIPRPQNLLALFTFLPPGAQGLALARHLRDDAGLSPLTLEYLGAESLTLLRAERDHGVQGIPSFPDDADSGVFMEFAPDDDEALGALVETLDGALRAFGGDLDSTWAGDDADEARRMRTLRHAVPDAVNRRIAMARRAVPGLHKVGTDLSVPDDAAEEMEGIYRDRLASAGMPFVLFGHAAENHLHANLIPGSIQELARAKALHLELAREAVRLGGAVTAEHGIGRLKRELLPIQFGDDGVRELQAVKSAFDPRWILGPGVLFDSRP
ncbi:MAG: FAD-binding oxidoreductase [Gemmatimonadales bacterium]|nr:MAG: FAD-binding oxidoreductase [Gemmatimonadales bacterium]